MAKPDWITLSKSSGSGNDTISVEAQPNAQRYCREGIVTVSSANGSTSKQVKVLQYGAETYKLDLTFVGAQEAGLFKIYSCYYTFGSTSGTEEDEDSTYTIKVKLLNDGLPLQLPDGSSTLELIVRMPIYQAESTGEMAFITPFKVSSKTSLSFYTTMFATNEFGTVVVDKDASTVECQNETLSVSPTTYSAPAAGETKRVIVTVKRGTTWTVE